MRVQQTGDRDPLRGVAQPAGAPAAITTFGVNTPTRGESCDQEATKKDKCPVVDTIHNVDASSDFIA
jgi:hypothetical protein